MNEKQLINKILKGNINSFEYFVDTYQDMAVTIAYRVCRNKCDAEDIVQNAFVKAFHNLHTFQNTSKFSTWFYRIVYNTAITHLRNSHDYIVDDLDNINTINKHSDLDITSQIDKKERSELLDGAMRLLPHDERVILTLFYLEENSIKDITMITGLSDTNVRVKLHRARKKLGEILRPIM